MHILTKVFVFIATMLGVLLAALTIVYAANVDRVRSDFAGERARYAALEAQASLASAQHKSEVVRLNDLVQGAQQQLSTLQSQISSLQAERSTLLVERDRAVSDRATTESKIGELGELAKTQATLLALYRDEVTSLRRNELTMRQRGLEMEDRLSDLESQRDVLEQNYRALQEELAQLRREGGTGAVAAAAGAVSGGESARPFTFAGPVISGRVTEVTIDPSTGRTLAKLSVGSNDRVARNMLMRVVRDNNFIANVVVESTDLSFSVGAVDTLGRSVTVQAGDVVVSRIQ